MAEKFRVVRRENQRRAVENHAQLGDLFHARLEEMAGVFVGGAQGGGAVVDLFFRMSPVMRWYLMPVKPRTSGRGQNNVLT